jgi:monovalent cation:H+ antiporter-2, CPA2 family
MGKLRKVGLTVYIGISAIEIVLMFLVSYAVAIILHWSFNDALFLGAALASSSTVIIAKVLRDMGKLGEVSSLLMMGILVAEDLIVVAMLSVMTSVFGASSSSLMDISWTLGKGVIFLVGAVAVGTMLIPRIIDWTAHAEHAEQNEHDEVLLLVALGICFAFSAAGNAVGLSLAIGAFLAGIFVASSKSSIRVGELVSSIRDMFAAIFFVSMGALIDITQFQTFLIPALIVTAMMIAGKVLGCGLGTRIFGYNAATALKVGLGMGQIGEFALIVAKAGQDLGVISSFLFPTIAVSVAITAFLSPYMIRLSYRIDLTRLPPRLQRLLG